jgi:hypothetical protein
VETKGNFRGFIRVFAKFNFFSAAVVLIALSFVIYARRRSLLTLRKLIEHIS